MLLFGLSTHSAYISKKACFELIFVTVTNNDFLSVLIY